MRKILIKLIALILIFISVNSCKKESLTTGYKNPIDVELSTDWYEDTLINQQDEKWYRYSIEPDVRNVYIEWSDKNNHGASRAYSAEILLDAFWLDGETEYFVGADAGYGSDAKLIDINPASGLLVRVRSNNQSEGTYAIKVYQKDNSSEIELVEINIADDWVVSNISNNQVMGFLVKGGTIGEEVIVQWAEFDGPEEGYSADIMGSVYKIDRQTAYKITGNNKSFISKDKSHSDNPKSIILDQGETEFIVIISLNDSLKPGSFALQTK